MICFSVCPPVQKLWNIVPQFIKIGDCNKKSSWDYQMSWRRHFLLDWGASRWFSVTSLTGHLFELVNISTSIQWHIIVDTRVYIPHITNTWLVSKINIPFLLPQTSATKRNKPYLRKCSLKITVSPWFIFKHLLFSCSDIYFPKLVKVKYITHNKLLLPSPVCCDSIW